MTTGWEMQWVYSGKHIDLLATYSRPICGNALLYYEVIICILFIFDRVLEHKHAIWVSPSHEHTDDISLFMYKHAEVPEDLINVRYVRLTNNTQQ